tara:strand:- start:120 stop:872 length:753 start_codon:yes stop_codon:yes gene_type:complete
MIRSNILKKYKNISHGFFNKNGGVSKGIYKSLNCGHGSKDLRRNVITNLKIVSNKIGCSNKNLVLLSQIHSNKVFIIKKITKKKLVGDAAITNKKGIALCILTADCAPVFFFDKRFNTIGAAHAGWRGAYRGIIKKTVDYFKSKGSRMKDILAIIGPCIKKNNYEVKIDFYKKFIKKDKKNRDFFLVRNKLIYFDLTKFIKSELLKTGIDRVETIKKDTFHKKNKFFSSRMSKKNNVNDYGRNISVIMIR